MIKLIVHLSDSTSIEVGGICFGTDGKLYYSDDMKGWNAFVDERKPVTIEIPL